MQDNISRTGSNWTGRTPRTTQEAGLGFFPQDPNSSYEEPTVSQKIWDVIAVVGGMTTGTLIFWAVGAYYFGI